MIVMENNKLQLNSRTEDLSLVENVVDEIFEMHQINQNYFGNVLVAVTEAVNNAMQHGNKFDPKKKVTIEVKFKESFVSIKVEDQGNGFDYSDLPDPTDPVNIEKPHGRGIYLMQHLADKVEYKNAGRSVELQFNMSAN